MPCREEFESELRKCKEIQNLIIDQSIGKYKFKDRVCEHVKLKCDDMNFNQLIEIWDIYSIQDILESYLMEVRNPILIDSRKGINKKTSNGNRKKRSDWNYDILKMPSVKSEIINSNNDIDQNVFEIFKKELKEKQQKKRNKLISSENGSGETPIIDTDTDDTTIAPIIEESDNTTEERYSLINETDT